MSSIWSKRIDLRKMKKGWRVAWLIMIILNAVLLLSIFLQAGFDLFSPPIDIIYIIYAWLITILASMVFLIFLLGKVLRTKNEDENYVKQEDLAKLVEKAVKQAIAEQSAPPEEKL